MREQFFNASLLIMLFIIIVRKKVLKIPLLRMLFIIIRGVIKISRMRNTVYGELSEQYLIYCVLGNLMSTTLE